MRRRYIFWMRVVRFAAKRAEATGYDRPAEYGKVKSAERKRVKVSGNSDIWTGFTVEVDGKPLEVRSVTLGVTVDEINAVRIVLDATTVQFDIHTPAES